MSKNLTLAQLFIQSRLIYVGFLTIVGVLAGCATPESQTPARPTTQAPGEHAAPPKPLKPSKSTPPDPAATQPTPDLSLSSGSPVATFAQTIAQDRGLPLNKVQLLLSQARYQSTVARLMTPPKGEQIKVARNWQTYRQRFVEPIRIRGGVAFMQTHAQTLKRAEKTYGVPAQIITAIIGVETLYGQHMGDFKVLDALSTLAFHYPAPVRADRVELFREQLADLIELHVAGKLDATTQKGSFAGAIGIPQFMPGSILRYAVSAQANTRIDLSNDVDDAIMSVGNFLAQHGWVTGLPVFAPATPPTDAARWVDGGLTPNLSWDTLKQAGANLLNPDPSHAKSDQRWQSYPLGVIDLPLPTEQRVAYRIGTPNFFALTQYNRSYFYASAVHDLSAAILQQSKPAD